MTPKSKVAALVVGLSFSYAFFVAYFVFTSDPKSNHPLANWLPWVALVYMLGGILAASVLVPRILRNEPKTIPSPMSTAILRYAKWKTIYLVVIWSGLFIYGCLETLMGRMEWQIAVPAGLFLLAFIAIFARSAYRMSNIPPQIAPYPPPELLQKPALAMCEEDEAAANRQRNLRILLVVVATILFLLRFL
jgi:hypothetical protein